jgi:hypothetical protein
LRDVYPLDFENDWSCSIVATGNHNLIVIRPAMHNRASLECGIDVPADGIPRL